MNKKIRRKLRLGKYSDPVHTYKAMGERIWETEKLLEFSNGFQMFELRITASRCADPDHNRDQILKQEQEDNA